MSLGRFRGIPSKIWCMMAKSRSETKSKRPVFGNKTRLTMLKSNLISALRSWDLTMSRGPQSSLPKIRFRAISLWGCEVGASPYLGICNTLDKMSSLISTNVPRTYPVYPEFPKAILLKISLIRPG